MTVRRVVVTGLGIVSPIGCAVDEFWGNLCAGKSGVRRISLFDASSYGTQIAAEVRDFVPPSSVDVRKARRLDRFALFGLAAALDAWKDAGIRNRPQPSRGKGGCSSSPPFQGRAGDGLDPFDAGVIIGSSHGGESTLMAEADRALHPERGPVATLLIPRMLANMASAQVSMALGLRGPNFATSSACATGAHAIGEGAEIIKRGDAQVMVCGAAEACITPLTLAGDDALGALSRWNDRPAQASRPFDISREGFVLGEGAGVLVLEDLERAQARGARIYCELAGYAATADAFHETRPAEDASGAARAMTRALAKAGVAPGEVSAVFAHATGTKAGDLAESRALRQVFGEAGASLPLTAIKSVLGHSLGASGAMQAVAAVKALQTGLLPPTINCQGLDPDCGPLRLSASALSVPMMRVLSNSFGFGGHNGCLVFARPV